MKPWFRKEFSPKARREMNTNWIPHWLFWNSLTHLILTTALWSIYSNPFFIIEETGAQRGELLVTQLELGPWSSIYQFSSVYSLSCVWLFVTPWTAAHQASLSVANSWSLLKLMSIKSVMLSNDLILCHPLLLPPLIFPSIRIFSNKSALCIMWPKYWSFSFSISLSNEYFIS